VLIEAVREGNLHAFGTLYERHVGAARALARRLCGNHSDADDVVGDVFTNTLRAIKSGRGPRDDLRPYVLTATRHTVIKLRTRRDSGRAIPTVDEQLDVPVSDDTFAADGEGETIGAAFVQLPDRFRNVLWLSCVEDLPPAEVGRHADLSAGAVSSLTLRARRALARSYLISRITQPIVSAECVTTRDLLPAVVRNEASAGTVARVDRHLADCCECNEAAGEMRALAGSLRTYPWFAAAVAWLRSLGGPAGAGGLAPIVVTAVAVFTFTAGDAPVVTPPAPDRTVIVAPSGATPAAPSLDAPAARQQHVVTTRMAPTQDPPAPPPAPVEMPIARPAGPSTESTTMLREAGVPTPPASIVEELVGDVVATPATTLAPVADTVGEVVDTTLGTVDQLGQQVASTSESIAGATGALLETVDETIVDVLDSAGAGQLAATVEPVLDTGTEVTDTTSSLLALTALR
jgi:RNA polymerase sigma factor (sigma-70 family)